METQYLASDGYEIYEKPIDTGPIVKDDPPPVKEEPPLTEQPVVGRG